MHIHGMDALHGDNNERAEYARADSKIGSKEVNEVDEETHEGASSMPWLLFEATT